jgi:hypothetical protein
MKRLVAIFLVIGFFSSALGQTVQTTPNLVTNTWTGVTPSTSTGGGFSGGNVPGYNSTTNTIMFGYNQATVAQTYAINQALSGSGVQVGGYNYSWQYLNNSSTGGTLSSTIKLTSPTGSTLEQYNYAMNTIADGWRTMSGTQNFNQQRALTDVGNLSISFTGKDARWWAGLYGPQVRDVNLSLNYTADPCASNPLYSTSCAGYNNVLTSQDITAKTYAINQALNLSGAGVQINGFQYGYSYAVGGDWCSSAFLIFCTGWSPSSIAVDVNVTSSTGTSLYSATHDHGANTSGSPSYSYIFPQQRLLSSMGNFSLSTREVGTTALYSSWSRWQYTPDPCVTDPLSSQSCPGYQQAYLTQQCTANPLYNSACPGYAQAMFSQQCSANPLSDASCPGYASAYLTYQCSINPLYSTTCAGYETAYFDQQCSLNPLYNSRCSGYANAYKNQQCSLNPLYDTTCNGYQTAYHDQQCSINPLFATDCSGYATAYKSQQCTANPLYATDCPGYAVAYKNQRCTANPLYATDCPGYEQAYLNSQCILDSLYSRLCAGYNTAYAIKYLTPISSDSTVANAVNGSLSDTAATKANDPSTTKVAVNTVTTSINTDGSVSVGVSTTGDTNVDKAITSKASTTNTAPAAVQLAPPPPPPQQQMAQNEPKGSDKSEPKGPNDKQEAKKDEPGSDRPSNGPAPQTAQGGQQGPDNKPAAPTARQEIQAKREAAAKAEAVEKGKNLANEMGKASDMEAQKAVQNVVIQAMGFTPGFDTYNKTVIPDTRFYRPYTVYNGQVNVDNKLISRRLLGGSDRTHEEMVDQQYNREK